MWFGEAPTSQAACDAAEELSPGHCEAFHATDESYWENIWYWSTPAGGTAATMDGRHDLVTEDDWVGRTITRRLMGVDDR